MEITIKILSRIFLDKKQRDKEVKHMPEPFTGLKIGHEGPWMSDGRQLPPR
jgi:hypothetical protein